MIFGPLVIATIAAFQAERSITLPTDWKVGSVIEFDLVREKEFVPKAGQPPVPTTRTPVKLEVIEQREGQGVMRWTYGRTALVGDAPANVAGMAERMANVGNGLALELITNATGGLSSLRNVEEVRAFYERAIGELKQGLLAAGAAASFVDSLLKTMEMFRDPALVSKLALKEPALFFMGGGGSLQLGKTYERDWVVPNPFGGEPLATKLQLRLESVSMDGSEAVITRTCHLDPESLRSATRNMMARTGPGGDIPPDMRIDVTDQARLVMDVRTGWPRSITHQRTIQSGDLRQIERTIFTTKAMRVR